MFPRSPAGFLVGAFLVALQCISCDAEDGGKTVSVQEIRSVLESIPPYLPEQEIATEIDVFGSTSMDSLAHGWASGFTKFHPAAKVVISAEGSETVLDRLVNGSSGNLVGGFWQQIKLPAKE